MSFGDPNNPYSQPPQQPPGQPGYGYPQQPPAAPGYGYPQAPPVGPYGGGPMFTMPGTVSAARVLLWVIVGLQVLGTILFAVAAASFDKATKNNSIYGDESFTKAIDYSSGMLWGMTAFAAIWGVIAIGLCLNFTNGSNGFRIGTMVFAIFTAIFGLYPFIIVGLIHTVLGILIACFVGGSNGSAWFNRPRY